MWFLPHSVIWNHVWSQSYFKHSTDVMKLIWRKSMSINYIFVGQQVCKQAHTHAKLYCTRATVEHLFKAQTDFLLHVQPWPNQFQIVEGAPRLAIYSSSISCPPSAMLLRTVAHRNISTTQFYRYYRGKTNSYRGENFYLYIANDKISPIPTEQVTSGMKQSLSFQILFLRNSNNKYSFVAL